MNWIKTLTLILNFVYDSKNLIEFDFNDFNLLTFFIDKLLFQIMY